LRNRPTAPSLADAITHVNPGGIVTQKRRLKGSFIYLANAVNDLGGNWGVLALVLAPLVLTAALCLLPDAINLQYQLASHFGPGLHNVVYTPVQVPYAPVSPANEQLPIGPWTIRILHVLSGVITLMLNLVVMCALERIHAGRRESNDFGEAITIYRRAAALAPSFFWVVALQLIVLVVGVILLIIPIVLVFLWMLLMRFSFVVDLRLLIVPAGFVIIWLYFAQYAVVFDRLTGWHALIHGRDAVRGRYFKVAMRIVVFFAVWSGYNSWAGGAFVLTSLVIGPVAALTDTVSSVILLLDFLTVAVAFATSTLFIAAGVRLYQDLGSPANEGLAIAREMAPMPTAALRTAPLSEAGS
jgi:hypothetical protein